MKKFLAVTAIFTLLACPLFAAAGAKAKAESSAMEVTSLTTEFAQDNYPGALIPGSISGTNTYLSDINLLQNTVLFDDIKGYTSGLILLKTDIGAIGLNISGINYLSQSSNSSSYSSSYTGANKTYNSVSYLKNISPTLPNSILGLMYGTKIASIPFGFGLNYGLSSSSKTIDDQSVNPNNDDWNTSNHYFSLKAGASLENIDLGASFSHVSNYHKDSYTYNYGADWDYDSIYDNSQWQIELDGRMKFVNDITASLSLIYANGTNDTHSIDDYYDNISRWTNSTLALNAVVGKDFNITENFKIKMATGINIGGDATGNYVYIDNINEYYSHTGYGLNSTEGDRSQYGWWTIPFNVVADVKLNETWTLNTGAQANIIVFNNYLNKYNIAGHGAEKIKEEYENSSFNITPGLTYALGVTGKIGDLTVNTYMNPSIITNGPYFLTGNSLSAYLNYGIAFKYGW
jgi:hypothetical protein